MLPLALSSVPFKSFPLPAFTSGKPEKEHLETPTASTFPVKV